MWLVKLRNWQLGNWEFCYPEYGIRNPGIGWKLREIKIRISEYGSWAVRDMGHGLYGKWVFGYTGSGNGSLDTGKMKRNLGNGYPFIPVRVVYTEKRSTMVTSSHKILYMCIYSPFVNNRFLSWNM